MSLIFSPLTLRGLTVPHRAWLAPMCQYSAVDGVPDDWHLVHLAARSSFGLVLTEATAVVPEGRISAQDTGLWDDAQTAAWARVTEAVHARGGLVGVQLAHAGRKASTFRPFGEGAGSVPLGAGGWTAVAPSPLAFPGLATPRAMTSDEVAAVPAAFAAAAARALVAGFDVIELHAGHGYLLHQFLSPLSNHRDDAWGGSDEGRARLLREVVEAVRRVWPDERPLMVRVSATDWAEGGLEPEGVGALMGTLRERGVDLVDVSTGGLVPPRIPLIGPGYQVPAARVVRTVSGLPVSAVGLVTDPRHAEAVLVEGSADAVMLGRAALREPGWPWRAAAELGVDLPVQPFTGARASVAAGTAGWPVQYARARLTPAARA